jgi:opacity protein-like surface antigen
MINNRDKIDDLFREGLNGYRVEPSQGLWEKIESRYFPSPGGRRAIIVTIVLLFLAAGSAIITWTALPERKPQPAESATAITTAGPETEMTSQQNEMSSQQYEKTSIPTLDKTRSDHKTTGNESNNQTVQVNQPSYASSSSQRAEMTSQFKHNADPYQDERKRSTVKVFFMTGYKDDISGYITLWDPTLTPVEPSVNLPVYKGLKNEYARLYELSAGATFMPAIIFYDPNPSNTGWSASLDLDYDRSRFHAYAGAGASYFKDKGSWEISYESYDSVGYYLNVNSFRVNPESPGEIIFDMSEKTVYDSVPHLVVSEQTNSYTYLDVPLGIGFTVVDGRRFALTVRTGVKFSWLIGKNEPTADFSITGAEDVFIDRLVPARTNTNWRFTAGLEASYLLTGRLSLRLEPAFEQYLNSVYHSSPDYQAGKPYLIGVNVGVRYRIK